MRKRINENPNGAFITIPQACSLTNLGRSTVIKLAEKYGALVRIGDKIVRIDSEILINGIKAECAGD